MTTGRKQVTEIQRLSTGGLKPLADLVDHLDLTSHFVGDAVLNGADPVIRSPTITSARHRRWLNLLIGIAALPSGMRVQVSRQISQSTSLTRCTICTLRTLFTSRAAPSMLVRNLST